jgi:hypothetical protein
MSHTSVKQLSSTGQQPTLDDLFGFGLNLLLMSIDNVRTVMRQARRFLPQVPDLALTLPKCPCAIPEVECPPRCVCEVTWEAIAGETLGHTVRVTNSSRFPRTFYLHATEFAGSGASPGTISLAPTSLTLASGQTGICNAAFTVPTTSLQGDYYAEIVVRGAYEQAVCIMLKVGCKKKCGDECCTCSVVQGDPPIRVRAHQWYHHFQCSEACEVPQGDADDLNR